MSCCLKVPHDVGSEIVFHTMVVKIGDGSNSCLFIILTQSMSGVQL